MAEWIDHPFEPFFDAGSRILILGTMPSPKSRAVNFYYGHPQNRFWRILSDLFREPLPETTAEKAALLTDHHIALWDVFAGCEINGADDASIRKAVPNDLSVIFERCEIHAVFTNGQKASSFYRKIFLPKYSVHWTALPSTSPANCRNWTYDTLRVAYSVILDWLD